MIDEIEISPHSNGIKTLNYTVKTKPLNFQISFSCEKKGNTYSLPVYEISKYFSCKLKKKRYLIFKAGFES